MRGEYDGPKGLNAHNFSCCDNIGGSAFRDWTMLMKHKGVFIGFRNHRWVVYASSDPSAAWGRGCQYAGSHGNPAPQSETAQLLSISALPEEAQALANEWVEEAIEIACNLVAKHEERKGAEAKQKKRERAAEHKRKIEEPWAAAVEDSK